MKRKQAIKFLDSVARYINDVEGTISVVNGKTGERIEIDSDMAFCFMGLPVVAMRDILSTSDLDGITPEKFVHTMTEAACQAYVQQLEQC